MLVTFDDEFASPLVDVRASSDLRLPSQLNLKRTAAKRVRNRSAAVKAGRDDASTAGSTSVVLVDCLLRLLDGPTGHAAQGGGTRRAATRSARSVADGFRFRKTSETDKVGETMITRPTDEKLQRFAWTYAIDDVQRLHALAQQQLSTLGISWQNATSFPPTLQKLGGFNQAGWQRWIRSLGENDVDGIRSLSRFAVTCARRLGLAATIGDDPIQTIVDNPQERLDVELKPWLDPSNRTDGAVIAKACMALRNNDGGYLVIGFEDDGRSSANPPEDLGSSYHIDRIQQIVSRYSSEPFSVSVEYRTAQGEAHPIIVVPSGVRTPVFSQSTIEHPTDNRSIIEDDAIYVRTVSSNGRASSSKLRRKDIEHLMRLCFDNREADIGSFFRRHLGGLTPEALKGVVSAMKQATEPPATARDYLDEGYARFIDSFAKRSQQMPDLGYWEAAAVLAEVVEPELPTAELLRRLEATRTDHSGWKPWAVINSPNAADFKPQVIEGKWEALINALEAAIGDTLEFWQIDPTGRFYTVRALDDDLRAQRHGIAPGTVLDFYCVVCHVTEVFSAVIQMSRAFQIAPDCGIDLSFRWRRIRGRTLTSWSSERRLQRQTTAMDDIIISDLQIQADVPSSAIPSLVYRTVRPLFLRFEGYDLPQDTIEEIAADVIRQRV